MLKVTYDQKNNSLMISEDGKPRFGIIGAKSEAAFKKLLKEEIERVEANIKELHKWIYNSKNVDKPDWMEKKRMYNSMHMKLENLQKLQNFKAKSGGVHEASITNLKPHLYEN